MKILRIASASISTSFLWCILLGKANAQSAGDDLIQTRSVSSEGGLLDVSLTIEYADWIGAAHAYENVRLLNGTLPGPTLRLKPGDKMRILFQNKLELQENAVSGEGEDNENEFRNPDDSNLHFHGAHVTGELPSDDVRISIKPGYSFQYETDFPQNHMPGTHWMHPHVHGSSALQVGAGAALAFVVEDPPGYLSPQVANAKEVLMLVQWMDLTRLDNIIDQIGDRKMNIIERGSDFPAVSQLDYRMVNGQFQPTIRMQPGEWQRWRIIHGAWIRSPLNFEIIDGGICEMHLLAKDGLYINDFPREISMAPIPAAGRADVMVRCREEGRYTATDFDDEVILNIVVSGAKVESDDLERWSPAELPQYLQDMRSTTVSDGCSCATRLQTGDNCRGDSNRCMNGEPFDPLRYVHTIRMGEVIERYLEGVNAHPYHQHVYPFQIVSDLDEDDDINRAQKAYFREGDWHDVIMIEDLDQDLQIRYQPDVHDGRVMIHCHRLEHEDQGMMAQEIIMEDGECACDAFIASEAVDPSKEAARTPAIEVPAETEDSEGGLSFCLSGEMKVEVKGKGQVPMETLEIGDFVQTEKLSYSRVYSFGHYDKDLKVAYLQLKLEGRNQPLEISPTHMLFIENNKIAVPASAVKFGDNLLTANGSTAQVLSIKSVTRRGAFAPFTISGKVAVNGVLVSNYISLMDQSHWIAHALLAPRRLYCRLFFDRCRGETRGENGIADWVSSPLRLGQWLSRQNDTIKTLSSAICAIGAVIMYGSEFLVSSSYCWTVFLLAVALFLRRKQQKALY